jgi:hydroxymethylpyrimidine/phosphomethylpyrimidine kinase
MSPPSPAVSARASPPLVLAFAASDPTGGAGVQADVLTLASRGCHPLSVLTAITVQDTSGVEQLKAVECGLVDRQARRLLAEMRVAAFKIGVLGSVANIEVIAALLEEFPHIPLVLDPILASGRGDPLSTDSMRIALKALLLPRTTVLTPNAPEARALAKEHDAEKPQLRECARRLLALGCRYVLITGTHEADAEVLNTLYGPTGMVRADRWPRLPGEYHGSGCTLASAIAAELAHGAQVPQAVSVAQEFTWQSLCGAFHPGNGQLIPDRFFPAREAQGPK